MRKAVLISGIVILVALGGCGRRNDPETVVTPTPVVLSQWASSASASSAYGMPDWSAQRATGEPDVEGCADDSRAWASARGNGLEWLDLRYDTPVYATEVRIYQTLGRGSLARVTLIDEAGEEQLVWQGTDTTEPCRECSACRSRVRLPGRSGGGWSWMNRAPASGTRSMPCRWSVSHDGAVISAPAFCAVCPGYAPRVQECGGSLRVKAMAAPRDRLRRLPPV